MKVALGLGLQEYPFASAQGFWRWVDLCEQAGADSMWQTDRLVSRTPILECMAVMAALAGRTRRMRFGMNVVSLALRDPVLGPRIQQAGFLRGGGGPAEAQALLRRDAARYAALIRKAGVVLE